MRLHGKVAVVTGGGAGIGRGIVLCMAQEGADIAIPDIQDTNALAVVKEVQALGRKAVSMRCDVTKAADVKASIETRADARGHRLGRHVPRVGRGPQHHRPGAKRRWRLGDALARAPRMAHLRGWLGRSSLRRTNTYASVVASSPPCVWTILVVLAVLSPGFGVAEAQTTKPAPAEATEPVIKQLEAFRRGDFDTAYTFASSEIKEQFSCPAFEQMVRTGYPEIAESTFATIAASAVAPDGHVYLSVKIRGANGKSIEAIYELVLESGQWKINGVAAKPDPGLV